MARTPLYSVSDRRPRHPPAAATAGVGEPVPPPRRRRRVAAFVSRHERWLWAAALGCCILAAGWPGWTRRSEPALTMKQIDAQMRESIANEPLASAAAAAYAAVLPSVVRVVGEYEQPANEAGARPARAGASSPHDAQEARSVGTGVVIVDKGLILTNLHVVAGAKKIMLTFMLDGSEAEAVIVGTQPQDDLAVLQAKTLPDDLHAATMRSTGGLGPGDEVIAIGFPYGIGPSASHGVISGLKREFVSPAGRQTLTNLIQFDAAANPGNSGGPLVTMDGHVVGIVTAIMNPTEHRTFIGIGFAVPIENAASAVGFPPF